MSKKEEFINIIDDAYNRFEGRSITLGVGMLDGEAITDHLIKVPLKTLNRHGLISGATGTGKTKTMQLVVEQLSDQGVPSLVMDIKGDISGLAVAGKSNEKIESRHKKIGIPYKAAGSPTEFFTLSSEKGARLRATVSEFGPILISKILELNDIQSGIMSVIFKYADDNQLALLDLEDLKKTMQYVTDVGQEDFTKSYGEISSVSVGTMLRKIIELEQQGANLFFGEPSFEVTDLLRNDDIGRGFVNIVRLTDIQDRPKLFSSFMLQLLAEIYASFPEQGDAEKPKLMLFIDEAHLVFNEASKALLNQLEVIIKLIRSKGVGVFFITQTPTDIPDIILSQLGCKIQHSLRAFTAKDRKAIKLTAENYPESEFYDTAELLTNLGIGECFLSALNEKGIPTPLAHCYLRAPQSRMDVLSDQELSDFISISELYRKYSKTINRESAYEILSEKLELAQAEEHQEELEKQQRPTNATRQEKSVVEKVLTSSAAKSIGNSIARELTRGLLGVLGINTSSRRTKSKGLFGF